VKIGFQKGRYGLGVDGSNQMGKGWKVDSNWTSPHQVIQVEFSCTYKIEDRDRK